MLTIIIKIMTVIRKKLETTWRVKEGFTEEVILKLGLALPWWSSGCWFDSWFGKNPQVHAPQLRVVLARTPLQYSCLENPMDGGACWAAVHGVAKSRTRLSDFTFTFMRWRRKWQPTPVFLPGESQERGSLVGCHLWGRTESDTTEAT